MTFIEGLPGGVRIVSLRPDTSRDIEPSSSLHTPMRSQSQQSLALSVLRGVPRDAINLAPIFAMCVPLFATSTHSGGTAKQHADLCRDEARH